MLLFCLAAACMGWHSRRKHPMSLTWAHIEQQHLN